MHFPFCIKKPYFSRYRPPITRTLETLHSSILSRFYFFPLLPNNVLRNNAYILAYRKATENRSYPKLKYLILTRQEGRKIMESIYEQINKTRNDVFFPYFFHLDKTSLKQRFHLAFHSQRSQPNWSADEISGALWPVSVLQRKKKKEGGRHRVSLTRPPGRSPFASLRVQISLADCALPDETANPGLFWK